MDVVGHGDKRGGAAEAPGPSDEGVDLGVQGFGAAVGGWLEAAAEGGEDEIPSLTDQRRKSPSA